MPHQRRPSSALVDVLAQNVRHLRAEKRLSQEDLAEQSGLHRTYIGSVERGERNASLGCIEALAKALDVSVPALLTQRTDHNNEEADAR